MFNGNTPSLADIAAVTDNNRNNGMMGMDGMGGWWVLIILLALFGGFGNGGWGNGNRNNSNDGGTTIVTVPGYGYGGFGGGWGAFDAASMQRGFDTSGIIGKLDRLGDGLCSLGYDQLAQMNALGNTVQQTGWGLSQQMQNNAIAEMQADNALQALIQSCCCKQENMISALGNSVEKSICQTNWNMSQMGRDIMDNQNANARRLEDVVRCGFDSLKEQGYISKIEALQQALADCNMRSVARDAAQWAVDEVRPCPKPSYDVPNPFCNCGGCGYNR